MPPTREPRSRQPATDPLAAEALVRRKAAELEAVFEALGDGLLVINSAAFIVEANQAALALLGHKQKSAALGPVSAGLTSRVLRTDGSALNREDLQIAQVLRSGEIGRGECVLRPEFGGPRWIETVTSPIRDGDGSILGAAIVARDVTHQRRRERDLGLVAGVTDALMSADSVAEGLAGLAGRCVQDLGDWCAVYQVEDEFDSLRLTAMRQRDGRFASDLAALLAQRPPRISEGFAGAAIRAGETLLLPDLVDEVIRRHAGVGVEAQMVRRLGLRSLVAAPIQGGDGPVGALCVGWNSASRRPDAADAHVVDELARRASLALAIAREKRALERALDSMEQVLHALAPGLLILDGDGRAILVNESARDTIGLDGDGVGETLTEILMRYEDRFEDARDLDDLLTRTAALEEDALGEFRLRQPRPVDIHWLASPVRDERGFVVGSVMAWVDVTHIRAAERVKDDLAADLAEALRSPLHAISNHAVQTLRRGRRSGADPALVHGLEVILRNARQISMHVNDLVDAARFDAAALTLDLLEIDVHDVVQQAVDQARAMTTTHRFRLDVPPAVPPPRWDPDRVRQALLHVLSNAIKYWPEGGQVSVKVRPQVDGVVISVRDRGLGVPPADHERVFERYFRLAGDGPRRRIRGNGLGLYLVRGVVEAHGGNVWIESSGIAGEGTVVHILLPWMPPEPEAR